MYSQRRMVRRPPRLGLLVTLVVSALSACGGEKQQQFKPQPLPEDQQELRPSVYGSEEFKPSLSFRVGEGWSTSPPEASDALLLTREETVGLGFVNAQEVYKPTKSGTPTVAEAPEDMVGWFQQHPYLQTDKPEPVTVGGVKGVQFDVVVEDLPEDYSSVCCLVCCSDDVALDLFWLSTGGFPVSQDEGDKVRGIVLDDVKGETVTIGFVSPATEFDEFAPEAQKVIDTVRWRDS
jgi:hypothetical protein